MRHAAPAVLSASMFLLSTVISGCETSSAYDNNFGYSTATTPVVPYTPTTPYGQTSAIRPVAGYTPRPYQTASSASVVYANDATFDREVGSASVPVVLNFTAKWCGPCHAMAPTVDSLAAERAGRVKVIRIDFDQSPAIVRRYNISALPATLVLRNGVVVKRMVGYQSRENLSTAMASAMP